MKREEFDGRVYRLVSMIPRGRVATYGQIAFLIGMPRCPRQVGRALHSAPDDPGIPCHRVVTAGGRLVPGWREQRMLLSGEGVRFRQNGTVDLKRFLWREDPEIWADDSE